MNNDKIDWLAPENRFSARPMDLLRQGLRTGNWEAISVCYLMLTGEKIEPLVAVEQTEQPQAEALQKVPVIDDEVIPLEKPKIQTTEPLLSDCVAPAHAGNDKLFTKATQHDTKPRKSTWVDNGTEAAAEIVKDRQVPADLQKHRPPIKMVKVRCTTCGKIDTVDAGSLPYGLRLTSKYRMKYHCNDCCVGAKSEGVDDTSDEQLFEGEI